MTDSALIDHIATLGDPECWSGSTATICFIDEHKIISANVGDSSAVIGRKGKPISLTEEHRPTLSTGANDVDVFVFFTVDAGTTYYGFTAGQDLS